MYSIVTIDFFISNQILGFGLGERRLDTCHVTLQFHYNNTHCELRGIRVNVFVFQHQAYFIWRMCKDLEAYCLFPLSPMCPLSPQSPWFPLSPGVIFIPCLSFVRNFSCLPCLPCIPRPQPRSQATTTPHENKWSGSYRLCMRVISK